MNNKGQVLIIFVILFPIFLMILTLIIDLGLLSIEKRKMINNTYDAVEYYAQNMNEPDIDKKTNKLLKSNLSDIEVQIIDNDKYVEIIVIKEYESLYNLISKEEKINISYKIFKENKEIIKG